MPIYKVRYDNFKPENLKFADPEPCEANGPGGSKIVYFRIKFTYDYEIQRADGSMGTVNGPLYIEGPKENSRGPSSKQLEKSGKMQEQWSIMTKYDLTNPEHFAFVNRDTRDGKQSGTIHKLVMACAENVFKNRKKVNQNDCEDTRDVFKKFHYPLLWELDGGVPTGKDPAGFWKLFRYTGKSGSVNETSFILPIDGGKKLDWSQLEGTQMEHMPVFKVENITIAGGKPTVKVELASSAVLTIKDRSAVNLLGDIDNDLTPEEKEERRKAKEKYASTAAVAAKPTSPKTASDLIAAIPSIDGTPETPQQKIPEELPVTNNLANLSLPADILPMPKSEPTVVSTPNAALNAMASSTAGTLPIPVLPAIN
jgi:hypothetical protein